MTYLELKILGLALEAEAIVFFLTRLEYFWIFFIIPSLKQLKPKFAHLQKADWDEDNDPEKYFAAKFFEKKPERPSTDKLVWWIARHTIAPRMP